MKVHYEEKTYESYFNNELNSKCSIYFPPGQSLEGLLGFDVAANCDHAELWRLIGHPFLSSPDFLGADLRVIAQELEGELEFITQSIPSIKANLLLQYKRPEYITTANGNEWHHWKENYYRYRIYCKQHRILEKISESFGDKALVLYASPAINSLDDLIACKQKKTIIENSNFISATELNNHSVNTYTKSGTHSFACSEPEKLEHIDLVRKLESLSRGQDLSNVDFIQEASEKILANMQYSEPFQILMGDYEKLKKYKVIYSFMTMKVFREITGVQWLLSL